MRGRGLLTARDARRGLAALADIGDACNGADGYARGGVAVLGRLVASELTTLSACHIASAQRVVVGVPAGAIGASERAAFDRNFRDHPLVRFHAFERGRGARRISDSLSDAGFRRTPLYNDYYRRIGLDRALAIPLWVDDDELVSFVLNRNGRDFADRELALLDALRPTLAALYRSCLRPAPTAARRGASFGLTPRENEAMSWVVAGKTDRDIAEILAISVRTVHKHLQRSYAKLGVETRTAAAMRLCQSPRDGAAATTQS